MPWLELDPGTNAVPCPHEDCRQQHPVSIATAADGEKYAGKLVVKVRPSHVTSRTVSTVNVVYDFRLYLRRVGSQPAGISLHPERSCTPCSPRRAVRWSAS